MAQGSHKGNLSATGASTTATNDAVGSVAVQVGDVIYATFVQQSTPLTGTGVTDNLGNSYSAVDAGQQITQFSTLVFYSIATSTGTLTTVSAAATASSRDWAFFVNVIEGPYSAQRDFESADDADTTSPFATTNDAIASAADDLVIASSVASGSTSWAAQSPATLLGNLPLASAFHIACATRIAPTDDPADTEINFTAGTNPSRHVSYKSTFIPQTAPGHRDLTFSGFAPTLSITDLITVSPPSGNLLLQGVGSPLDLGISPVGDLTLTGFHPVAIVEGEGLITAPPGLLAFSAFAPDALVSFHLTITPDQGNVAFSTTAPTVVTGIGVTSADLILSADAPVVAIQISLRLSGTATLQANPTTAFLELLTDDDAQLVYAAEISLWARADRQG